MSRAQRLAMVEPPSSATPSLRRQCQLLGISRSYLYYQNRELLAEDLRLMRLIDVQHLLMPVYGLRRRTVHFNRLGHRVNRKRIRRLMRQVGAACRLPRTTDQPAGQGAPHLPLPAAGG